MKSSKLISLWDDRPYPPFLMVPAVEATVFELPKLFPSSKITFGGNYWKDGKNIYFYSDSEYGKTISNLVRRAVVKPNFLIKFFREALLRATRLNKFSGRHINQDLKKISTKELIEYLDKFYKKFIDMYRFGTVPSLLGYRDDSPLYLKINDTLLKKTKRQPEKFTYYLVALTNPPKRLKTLDQELQVLLLAKRARAKGIKKSVDIKRQYQRELVKIRNNFGSLSYDFTNLSSWNLDHYSRLVAGKIDLDIDKLIADNKNYELMARKRFEDASKELSLAKGEIIYFKLVSSLGYYKWQREYEFQEAFYNAKFIQEELGRRCRLSKLEAKYILPNEYQKFYQSDRLKKIAKIRFNNFLALSYKDRGTIFSEGKAARRKFLRMKFLKNEILTKNFSGMPAYHGRKTGMAKIVNTVEDIKKMNKGDILISSATNPNLLPAMKKAAAIVTNEGGITCHAAIVSRELKIPCVVGTKIATKVLKDGDKVEVDATKGVVRKI